MNSISVSCMDAMLRIEQLTPGAGLAEYIDDITRLRLTVFREWPYLYDGNLDYERRYQSRFVGSPGSVCVAAFDGDAMIGASTAMPLADEHEEIVAPFLAHGIDPATVYYLAESVLLPDYRGRGLYRSFIEGREKHARVLGGFEMTAFCGVMRPAEHPLRPSDYRPLDDIWRHFGYSPRDELVCYFPWKDIGSTEETEKPLRFWLKPLDP